MLLVTTGTTERVGVVGSTMVETIMTSSWRYYEYVGWTAARSKKGLQDANITTDSAVLREADLERQQHVTLTLSTLSMHGCFLMALRGPSFGRWIAGVGTLDIQLEHRYLP
jgi:hypothetical protein